MNDLNNVTLEGMQKQTAANNELIAAVKRDYNTKIFKKFSAIVNAEGSPAAIAWMQQFSRMTVTRETILGLAPATLRLTEQAREALVAEMTEDDEPSEHYSNAFGEYVEEHEARFGSVEALGSVEAIVNDFHAWLRWGQN